MKLEFLRGGARRRGRKGWVEFWDLKVSSVSPKKRKGKNKGVEIFKRNIFIHWRDSNRKSTVKLIFLRILLDRGL